MKTLQRVHTLKEIWQLIHALPLSAFDNDTMIRMITSAIEAGRRGWIASDEYADKIHQESKALEARRKKDDQRLKQREEQVKQWLRNGELVKGMFIKVTGTRDGAGIREFIDEQSDDFTGRLICRQWRVIRMPLPHTKSWGRAKKIGDVWVAPEEQMTTHDFCRVVKILTPRQGGM